MKPIFFGIAISLLVVILAITANNIMNKERVSLEPPGGCDCPDTDGDGKPDETCCLEVQGVKNKAACFEGRPKIECLEKDGERCVSACPQHVSKCCMKDLGVPYEEWPETGACCIRQCKAKCKDETNSFFDIFN